MTLDELKQKIGQELGVSEWVEITQARVHAFAEVTGDDQYIHVDPARAAATPYGGTIAHGFLTLSLLPWLNRQTTGGVGMNLGGRMSINYGLNRVRFPAPVPVGKRIRLHTVLQGVEDVNPGRGPDGKPEAVQITLAQTMEVEGQEKPALVAETLTRVYL